MKTFQEQSGNIVVTLRFYGLHGDQCSLHSVAGDKGGKISLKMKSAKEKEHATYSSPPPTLDKLSLSNT